MAKLFITNITKYISNISAISTLVYERYITLSKISCSIYSIIIVYISGAIAMTKQYIAKIKYIQGIEV